LLRLEHRDGQVGWGEIAPLAFFGSETLEQALKFCQSLPSEIMAESIWRIPESLPSCQFGFESAWEQLHSTSPRSTGLEKNHHQSLPACLLLPTGATALESPCLFTSESEPPITLKWKIGVAPIEAELAIFEQLVGLLPVGAKLRLDANGGLSWQQAVTWLQVCDGYGIEYLEQPLPPNQFDLMLKLSQRYETPIALDESVATLDQLQVCYQQNWRGIFVIKAPIAGSPIQLRNFCQTHCPNVVWSSVFETSVARRYIETHLMPVLPTRWATGFGVKHWFRDRWEDDSAQQLWQRVAVD
jgi:O-succinylbenzoate synthase